MKVKTATIITIVVLVPLIIANYIYGLGQGTIEGAAAIGQLNGDSIQYVASQAVLRGAIIKSIDAFGLGIILLSWALVFVKKLKEAIQNQTKEEKNEESN